MIYEIKRGNAVIWSGKAIGRQYRRIMQEDRVEVTINTASAIDFKKGNTLVAYGQTYKLNRSENISKKNTQIGYSYDIEFEALYYDFGKWILYTLDKDNALKEPAVYLMGDAKAILGLAIQNANRASSGWTLGVIEDTEVFQWVYSGAKLLTVIQDVADQTNLEFWFDNGGKRLNLTRRQPVTGIQLAYGKGNGLYELYRSRRDNPVVTHLTILGGAQNIPNNYGFRNIQPTGGNPMVNPNYVAGMDRVEDTVVYENIYPRLIAKVTATSAPNVIRSTDIDFDLNDHLLDDGTSAQIAFTSGLLNGFKFTIQKTGYVHATRQVTFNIIQDDKAYPGGVPDALLKPAVGDSFVFLNIDMPTTYVTNAEGRLKDTGDQYFAEEGVEQFDWSAKITPKFALENNTELVLGGLVHLKADDIGLDGNIRIDSYSRDLQESYRYDFTLSNIISINSLVRQRNQSDRLANAVSKGISSDGLSTKATYAERAGYAGTAGHANTATNAATANFASEAAHAALADLAREADHALKADHAIKADHALKADLADNSILWNGLAQPNYLTQPVRPIDSPKFEGVSSPSFQSGWTGSGYRVSKDANGKYILEVDGLFVRGEANFYSLVVNELRATNGAIIVSDGIEITGATKTGSNYVCSFDTDGGAVGNPFRFDDVVKCQVWNGQGAKLFVGRVLSTTSSSFTISILQGSSIPSEGDHIVRIDNFTDNNRKGIVYITASDSGAPFVDTVYGMWTDPANSVKVRMGNLAGIVDPVMGTLTGFGLYGQNVNVRGNLWVTGGNAETLTGSQNKADNAQNNAINTSRAYTNTQFQVLDDKILLRATKTEVTQQVNNIVTIQDTRNTNELPPWYYTNYPKKTVREFKYSTSIGFTGLNNAYVQLTTNVPWSDYSGGEIVQVAEYQTRKWVRNGNATNWGSWVEQENTTGSQNKANTAQANAKTYTDAQISITNQAIELKASKTEVTQQINAIDVGGRNYLGMDGFNLYSPYYSGSLVNGLLTAKRVSTSTYLLVFNTSRYGTTSFLNGEFTFSGIVKINGSIATLAQIAINGSMNTQGGTRIKVEYDQTTGFIVMVHRFSGNTSWFLHSNCFNVAVGDVITIEGANFEKGNKPTAWAPAFEDINNSINSSFNPIRYIRDYTDGNSANGSNHWVEIEAINTDGINVALNKPVTASSGGVNLQRITDGVKNDSNQWAGASPGYQYVQIDLGAIHYNIKEINVWHFYADGRKYKRNKLQISSTSAATDDTWTVLFDSDKEGEYTETSAGRTHYNSRSRESLNNVTNVYESKLTVANDNITAQSTRIDGLTGRVNTAEAKITPDAINLTVKGQVDSKSTGRMLYRDPTFLQGNNGISAYNNASSGNVVVVRENQAGGSQPTGANTRLRITNTGTATPGLGGFTFSTPSYANARFITKFIALVPVGRTIVFASNAVGNGSVSKWLTPNKGTGNWEEYIFEVQCGATGSFSSTNFFYIDGAVGTPSAPVHWYLAFATVYNTSLVDDTPTVAEVESSFNMTANKMKLFSKEIEMSGIVTFQASNAASAASTADSKATNAQSAASTADGKAVAAQTTANTAQSTANTANTKAGQADTKATNAQTAAATADGKAVAAQNTANTANGTATTANNQVNAWKFPNKTTINGGAIETKSIKALQIDVENLFAQQITANNLTVTGNSKIGDWSIGSGIYSNTNSWGSNQTYSSFSPGDFLMRRNGSNPNVNQDLIEVQMGYLGLGQEIGAKIVNSIVSPFGTNTALALIAKNGMNNIALEIVDGTTRGIRYSSEVVNINTSGSRNVNEDYTIHIVNIYGGTGNFGWNLPTEPKEGEVHYFLYRKTGGASFRVYVNGGIPAKLVDASSGFASGIDLKVGFLTKFIYISSIGGWITDMLP